MLNACNASGRSEEVASIPISITLLSADQYPDDPDIDHRSARYSYDLFKDASLRMTTDSTFDLEVALARGGQLRFDTVDLLQWIPTIPVRLQEFDHLALLAVVDQEWNRNQVAFRNGEFVSTDPTITRVDIARNCLNAYLWEIIAYTTEDGHELPVSHGWFNFPQAPYQVLFERRNNTPFATYAPYLEHWKDPSRQVIDRDALRTVVDSIPSRGTDRNNAPYPLTGERLRKRKEVVYPVAFATMRDLCSDSTTFATFSPPGIYVRADHRRTQLGRMHHLVSSSLSRLESDASDRDLAEIDLLYSDAAGQRLTHFVVGGIDLSQLPVLPEAEANSAWACSMGFGNHPFHETYAQHLAMDTWTSPYYAFLSDAEGAWLDSHSVGIDGPLLHFSDPDRRTLHVWLLSFERHALVGHVVIELI